MRPFYLEFGQFRPHGGELLLEILLRAQAMISGEGIGGEITDEQSRENVETENGQKGAASAMGDHGPQDCVKPVKGGLNSPSFVVLFESGPVRAIFTAVARSCTSTPWGLAGGATVLQCSLVCSGQSWRR